MIGIKYCPVLLHPVFTNESQYSIPEIRMTSEFPGSN